MRLKRVDSKKTIGSKVFNSFILIILIISMGFIFLLYERNSTFEKYDEFTKINIKLSELSLELSNSWGFFDMYIKTMDNENIKKYSIQILKLKN
jgi:hypothetical protein